MIVIKLILLSIIGLSAGGAISAGVFSFVTSLGVIPRIASNIHSGKYIKLYENIVIIGGIAGGIIYIFEIKLSLGMIGAVLYGLTTGVFVGSLAVALAELLNSMTVFARRIHLTYATRAVIYSLAMGKLTGSLIFFLNKW